MNPVQTPREPEAVATTGGPSLPSGWLLTSFELGRRNRRPIDLVFLGLLSLLAAASAVIANLAPVREAAVGLALRSLLGWAPGPWRVAVVAPFVVLVLVLIDIGRQRRWALGRDVLLALIAFACLGGIAGRAVGPEWFAFDTDWWSRWGFPDYRLGTAISVATIVWPELKGPPRVVLGWLLAFAGVALLALGAARPSDVLSAVAVGLGAGILVRLGLGSAAGVPPSDEVARSLRALGLDLADLIPARPQEIGAATYVGRDGAGRSVRVRLLGRDAQDAQRLARRWRLLAYRDPPRSAPVGRLEQVEHEALITLMAARAGVRVPEVLMATVGDGGDASIVTRQPDVAALEVGPADEVSDAVLGDLWTQVALLHGAGISHGRLNAGHVVLEDGEPMLIGFGAGTLGAPQATRDIDVAELLVACSVLVGPARALAAAVSGVGIHAVADARPYLQRAALTPHVRDLSRPHEMALKKLRRAAAEATGTEPVEMAPLRRVRLQDLVVAAAAAFSAYLLISQLAGIGFRTIAQDLLSAEPAWLVTGLVLAQVALVPKAVSLRGAVVTPLPLLPCVALKTAHKFIGLTTPGSTGTVAATVRFVQRMGGSSVEAVTSGAIDDLAKRIVRLLLIVAIFPFVDFDLDLGQIRFSRPDPRLIIAAVVVVLGGGAIVWLVPVVHNKVIPPVRQGLISLVTILRTRSKRLELFGGNLVGEIFYALTLGAVCHAYGVGLGLAPLLLVHVVASELASLAPVPGGVGAAEAAITAGLIACGVDESTAFAIAITHRLCTNYLPPVAGYFALMGMRRGGYL